MSSRLKTFLRSSHGSDRAPGLLVALVAFAAYFATLAPSIGFIDAGELAVAAHTVGVAHPTGYPLFTMLASVFAKFPLGGTVGGTVIWKLNLLAALLCATSVWAFYALFLALLRAAGKKARVGFVPTGSMPKLRIAAATGALSLAFVRTFWAQATGVEVYYYG
jgi:hypothetical protein